MADYFDELNCRPLEDGETPDHLLQLARLLRDYGMFDLLGTDQKLAPPASKHVIENLPTETTDAGSQCPVCLKDFETGEEGISLPCKHQFHPNCILPWLHKTSSCPLCRYQLPTDDPEYEEYKKEKKREQDREKDIQQLHNSMFS